jgi:predicted  nucleic acid-binding Zn-ribbon protein
MRFLCLLLLPSLVFAQKSSLFSFKELKINEIIKKATEEFSLLKRQIKEIRERMEDVEGRTKVLKEDVQLLFKKLKRMEEDIKKFEENTKELSLSLKEYIKQMWQREFKAPPFEKKERFWKFTTFFFATLSLYLLLK